MKYLLIQLAVSLQQGGDVNIPALDGDQVLRNVLNIAYFLAGIVAVIVIIIAGINYATSSGDSGRVTKAKNMILFAVIGIIVILSAFAITNFVLGRFR